MKTTKKFWNLFKSNEISLEGDIHQNIISRIYQDWVNKDELKDTHWGQYIKYVLEEYGELPAFLILTDKYYQQMSKGGHYSYYMNGYTNGPEWCDEVENDPKNCLHELFIKLSKKFYKDPYKTKMVKFLKKFKIEIDRDKYLIEDIQDSKGRWLMEETLNPDFGQVINGDYLDKLDIEFYKNFENYFSVLDELILNEILTKL